MRELPILFSTPMVQAILDGRKSMTRRICKDIPDHDFHWGLDRTPYKGNYKLFTKTEPRKWGWVTLENQWLYDLQTAVDESKTYLLKPPYQPGDHLWVQETWKIDSLLCERPDYPVAIDFKAIQSGYSHAEIMCKFTPDRFEKFKKFYQKPGWQSPYFMPKEAARIWLEVTDVRVERLQDMKLSDVYAEGIISKPSLDKEALNPWKLFIGLWDDMNAKRGYGWDTNCWVWVIEFRRINP